MPPRHRTGRRSWSLAAKEVSARVRRAREDSEIEAIMRENAADDAALAEEFESTLSDGL